MLTLLFLGLSLSPIWFSHSVFALHYLFIVSLYKFCIFDKEVLTCKYRVANYYFVKLDVTYKIIEDKLWVLYVKES